MRQLVHFYAAETGTREIVACSLAAPHGTETLTTLRQRDGHAVHNRDGVEQWAKRVFAVVVVMAGGVDVLGEVNTVWFQCAPYALQEVKRLRLVVDRVEGSHKIERSFVGGTVEIGEIPGLEAQVVKPAFGNLLAGPADGILRQVVAEKLARWKTLGQLHQRTAAAATEIERTDAGFKPPGEFRRERQDRIKQLVTLVESGKVKPMSEGNANKMLSRICFPSSAYSNLILRFDRFNVNTDYLSKISGKM